MSTAPRRTLEQIRSDGAIGYAANLIQQGYSADQVAAGVARRYPDVTDRTVQAVVSQGQAAAAEADALSFAPAGTRILARDVPGPRSAAPNFRYYGRLALLDPSGGVVDWFPFLLEGQANLSSDDLLALVVALYGAYSTAGGPALGRYHTPASLTPGGLEVTAVERR